jgi:hypothetical protein
MEYWASAEEMWEAARQDRENLPQRGRQTRQVAEERHRKALLAGLDRSLAELTSGGPPRRDGITSVRAIYEKCPAWNIPTVGRSLD